jgi:hypothetical protein
MENLLTVNNRYLGVFKKDDINNNSIKIGRSLQQVDSSKIDPTLDKHKRTHIFNPYEEKHNPYTYCNKDTKDKAYNKDKFLSQPMGKDIYKVPIKS